jgi:hypothetical protein
MMFLLIVLDLISDKLVSGSDPAVAIEETPIPEPGVSFPSVQTTGETEPLSGSELEAKSLPPSEGDTTAGNGTGIVEPSSPVQLGLIPEPISPGESAFIPGIGVLAPQAGSPIPPSETAMPTEPVTSLGDPSGPGLSQFIPSPPGIVGTTAEVECLGSLELCTEPVVPSPSPVIDLCQEQWYLPECTQNGNDLEEEMGNAQPQAPYYDEGGYQQLPYYYEYEEPVGYQEGEDQYSENNGSEEEDYEGGYQEYEQDYSEEEDSGDEEDDYEEVGGYQEEEENYSEEEVEEDDGGEEEDFTEEEEESVEYSEE